MSLSNAPNSLPWLAEDNSLQWQEQVMAYLQQKQIAQYVMGWACFLPPNPLTALTDAKQLIPASVQTHAAVVTTWENAYDDWRIKDNMAMGVIKGTLCGQYLTYVVHCTTSKAVWDAILSRLKTQNLGLAVHNTKQLMYNHPYLRGPIEEYLKHFAVTNEQLACIGKVLPDSDVAHWMLENLLKDDPSWKSEIDKLSSCLPCSLQLSLPAKSERVNVLSDGDCMEQDVLDDRDVPDNEDDTVLLVMALKNREVFISVSLDGKSKLAYHDHTYIDSGATCSISPVIQYFDPASLKQLRALVIIHVGNNNMLLATAVGDLPFLFNVGDTIKNSVIRDVLNCMDIATTLISASQLNAHGNRVILDGPESRIVHKPSGRTIACMHLTKSGLYCLDASLCPPKVFVSLATSLQSLNINDLHR